MDGDLSLVNFSGVGVELGGSPVLRDVSFSVASRDRWGVVGRNGAGKSTLFRLLAGDLRPDTGSINRDADLRVGLLDQHRVFEGARTVWEAAAGHFAHLVELERSLEEQSHALAADASPDALARYDADLHRFEREGGYTFAARVDAVLEGLGFDPAVARDLPLEGLSGGERGRLGLARQLAAPADVLLLDEPTNHLDLETTRWLEEHLAGIDATLLVISHDRAFLDALVDHVLHLEDGTAFAYEGGYAAFVNQRAERRLTQARAFDAQRKKIAAEEDYIRRNIAGQNTRQARGRRTRLARLPRLSPPPQDEDTMSLRLEATERGGEQVLVAEDVGLRVAGRTLLEGFDDRVVRGERIGLVGANGTGKSTLLRSIVGDPGPDRGRWRIGASVEVAFYRQDMSQVPVGRSLFDVIHDLRPAWNRGQVQAHLGRFGFSGDEVARRTETLSGGELARVALAMMMLSGANLILLDEPTNHLDVESIEALEDAIERYDGTVVLVSHDRELLRSMVTRVWSLEKGRMRSYPGSFGEWEARRTERLRREAEASAAEALEIREQRRARDRRGEAERRERLGDIRRARRLAEAAEARVEELERALGRLRAELARPELYESADGVQEAAELAARASGMDDELEAALEEWEKATEKLHAVEADDPGTDPGQGTGPDGG